MKKSEADFRNEILSRIEEIVQIYNNLEPENPISIQKKDVDVSNVFVCAYNNSQVGLFKKRNYFKLINSSDNSYDAGSVYLGIRSNYIGIKKTHDDKSSCNSWQPAGSVATAGNEKYVSNCDMNNEMSFDDMRLCMYNDGEIDSYEIGVATFEEMLKVLKYASYYFRNKVKVPVKRLK
ncbi:MAG: hypothetical protein U0M66_04765 [Bacilli bacterium]|nr:hypothetical protein [Bacilli bacterium]